MKPGKLVETGTDQHVVHGFLPFFHAYGFLTSLFESLYCGFMVVTMSKFIPDLFLQVIQQFKVRNYSLKLSKSKWVYQNSKPEAAAKMRCITFTN